MSIAKLTESQEQRLLVQWFDLHYPQLRDLFFHIPNGGQRHVLVAKKMKAEGVRPGIPDLLLAVPRQGRHGLFIEMKARGGRLSQHQQLVIPQLKAHGYEVEVCQGFDAARDVIRNYMGFGP